MMQLRESLSSSFLPWLFWRPDWSKKKCQFNGQHVRKKKSEIVSERQHNLHLLSIMNSPTFDPNFLHSPNLVLGESLIPNAGRGVFTNQDISERSVVCQYYGTDIAPGKNVPPGFEDRLFETRKGHTIVPDEGCLAQYVNDIYNIPVILATTLFQVDWAEQEDVKEHGGRFGMTRTEVGRLVTKVMVTLASDHGIKSHKKPAGEKDSLGREYLYDFYDHNLDWQEHNGRVYLTATRDICAGEELFVDYGRSYWSRTVTDMIVKENMRSSDAWEPDPKNSKRPKFYELRDEFRECVEEDEEDTEEDEELSDRLLESFDE